MENIGKIIQIIGPVVDIKFESGELPEIYNAVLIKDKKQKREIVCEVEMHLGENNIRAIAMTNRWPCEGNGSYRFKKAN